jgi:hypothetical protein
MWKSTAILAGSFAVALAQAQPAGVLLEACNALQDSAKRLECLKAAIGESQQKAPAKFEAVTRAFVGLQGGIDSGMSYRAYQSAIVDVARELAIFARDAAPEHAAGVHRLQTALDTYGDAGTFWVRAIEFYARRGNDIAYSGGLPMKLVGIEWMIGKHSLPTRNSDIWGLNAGVPTDVGRSLLLRKARVQAEEGLKLLTSPPPPNAASAPPQMSAVAGDPLDSQLLAKRATESVAAAVGARGTADFRKMFVGQATDGRTHVLCGEVRQRSGDGTHSDYRRFYSQGDGNVQELEGERTNFSYFWQIMCGHKVADISEQ